MSPQAFFAELWADYLRLTPQAGQIQALFHSGNPAIVHDHVAFRTLDHSPVALQHLEPLLLDMGYQRFQPYTFPEKHLQAWSYTPATADLPRIFFSELLCAELSTAAQTILRKLTTNINPQDCRTPEIFMSGRLWSMPGWDDYSVLAGESEYAAWVAAIGLRANHFTLSVNALHTPRTLQEVVARVEAAGFAMNQDGGVIKGRPAELLEQAATLADHQSFVFRDGDSHEIPTCYYEFARRYPTTTGELYQGFVAANAARIFTSTDRRP